MMGVKIKKAVSKGNSLFYKGKNLNYLITLIFLVIEPPSEELILIK